MKPVLIEYIKWIADICLIAIGILIAILIIGAVMFLGFKIVYSL